MKTRNFEFGLMQPNQQNKEVFFNETIGVLDSFCINSVVDFVDSAPSDEYKQSKFIIKTGEYRDHICYSTFPGKRWHFLKPKQGMIVFCVSLNCFVCYDGKSWVVVHLAAHSSVGVSSGSEGGCSEKAEFQGVSGDTQILGKLCYLYMNGNAKICLSTNRNLIIDIVIKQNYSMAYRLSFDVPILWNSAAEYQLTATLNSIDKIRLTKLPETEHFLGEIIHRGFKY